MSGVKRAKSGPGSRVAFRRFFFARVARARARADAPAGAAQREREHTSKPVAPPPAKRKTKRVDKRGAAASVARMAEAARQRRREAREDAMTLEELLAAEDAEVQITGERTWAERDTAARALAVELDDA